MSVEKWVLAGWGPSWCESLDLRGLWFPAALHVFLCKVSAKSIDLYHSPPEASQVAPAAHISSGSYLPRPPHRGAQIRQGSLSLQRGDCLILLLYRFFFLLAGEWERKTLISNDEFTLRRKKGKSMERSFIVAGLCVRVHQMKWRYSASVAHSALGWSVQLPPGEQRGEGETCNGTPVTYRLGPGSQWVCLYWLRLQVHLIFE